MPKSTLQLVKKSSLPLALKVTNALMGLLFNFVATQYLPTDEFGIFALGQVLILFLVTFAKIGLENTLIKLIASNIALQQHYKINSLYTFSLIIVSIMSTLVASLTWLFDDYLSNNLLSQPFLLPLIPIILVFIFTNSYLAINASTMRGFQHPNLALLFTGLVTLLISIILTLVFKPTTALALIKLTCIAAMSASFLSFLIGQLLLKVSFSLHGIQPSIVLSSCIPLWTSSIVALIIQQFSTLILARYASLDDLGIYAICSKVSLLMVFVLVAVNAIIAPKFAELYASGNFVELKAIAKMSQRVLLTLAVLMTIGVFLLANFVLGLFGETFIQGTVLLKILALGQFVNVGTGSVVTILIMTGHERIHQRNTLVIAIITISLALVLVPLFGALGAAITTASAMALQNLLSYYFAQKLVLNKSSSTAV